MTKFLPSDQFLDRSNCIIWQYGNYTAKSVNKSLNGVNTQGENIADNGGIKEAYRAYNSWVERHGAEPRLPGMQHYTQHQVSRTLCEISLFIYWHFTANYTWFDVSLVLSVLEICANIALVWSTQREKRKSALCTASV